MRVGKCGLALGGARRDPIDDLAFQPSDAAGTDPDPAREVAGFFQAEDVLSAVGDYRLELLPIEKAHLTALPTKGVRRGRTIPAALSPSVGAPNTGAGSGPPGLEPRARCYDVTGYNWRGFYTGGKVSDEAYKFWVDALKKVYDSPQWQKIALDNGLTPIWRGGDDFQSFVQDQVAKMRKISKQIGVIQ
jgi:hypothetical protein